MGGEFHEVAGTDIAAAMVDFARAENATQIVLGASGRSRWEELVRGSVINRVVRLSGPIDVHVISNEPEDQARPRRRRRRRKPRIIALVTPRRLVAGWLLALAGVPLLTLALAQLRGEVGLRGPCPEAPTAVRSPSPG